MRYVAVLAMAAMVGMMAGGAMAASDSEVQNYSFPHAGIDLSAPRSYQMQVPNAQTTFLSMVKSDGRQPVATLELAGYPVDSSVSLDKFSQQSVDSMRKNLVIRHLRELKQVPMPIAGQPGIVRLVSYKFRGDETLTAIVCFSRPVRANLRLMYSLTIDCMESEKGSLLPLLGRIASSIKLTEIKNTWECIGEPNSPIGSSDQGYMIRPPIGWSASVNRGNVMMGQVNYLTASMTPVFQINTSKADNTDAAYCGKLVLEKAMANLSQGSLETTVLSQGPSKLAGVNAYQFTIRQLIKNPETAPSGENPPLQNIICQRCISMPYNGELKLYSLVVICSGSGDQKQAEMVMDKLSSSFKLLKSTATTEPGADAGAAATTSAPTAPADAAAATPPAGSDTAGQPASSGSNTPAGNLALPEVK